MQTGNGESEQRAESQELRAQSRDRQKLGACGRQAHLSVTVVLVRVIPVSVPLIQLNPETGMIRVICRVGRANKADGCANPSRLALLLVLGLEYMPVLVLDAHSSILLFLLRGRQAAECRRGKPAARYIDFDAQDDLLLAGILLECHRVHPHLAKRLARRRRLLL
jgi:hypothetical protein